MSGKLQPYPAYKDSGLPWLGDIPAHWQEKRAKYFFHEVDERSTTGSEQLMSVSHKTGVTPRKANVTMFMAESNVGHKICRPGDLVINTMWAWMAAMGVARQTGLVSPSYGVYRPRPDLSYVPEYVDHLVRTQPYVSEYICRSTGIRASRLRLYPNDFLCIPLVCPPIQEQESMVMFITHHDRRVRRFIRNRRRLIEVLNEQKQAIVNRAVTRGLNSNVRLKPSGIEWLGEIPKHWEARRLRTLAAVRASGVDKNTNEGEVPVMLCNNVNIYKNEYLTAQINFMEATATQEEICKFDLRAGDLVITKDSLNPEIIGVPSYVPEPLPGVICAYHLYLIRPFTSIVEGEFLFRALSSSVISNQFRVATNGVTIVGLPQGAVKSAFSPVPPLEEQRAIIDYINEKCAEISQAISRAEREIDLIREYRARLIADVVTGKIDVREIPVEAVEDWEEYLEEPESGEELEEINQTEEVQDANN